MSWHCSFNFALSSFFKTVSFLCFETTQSFCFTSCGHANTHGGGTTHIKSRAESWAQERETLFSHMVGVLQCHLTAQLYVPSQAAKEESHQALCAEISHLATYSRTFLPSKIYLELDLRRKEVKKKERKANLVKILVNSKFWGSSAVVREDSKHQKRLLCQCEDQWNKN